MIRPLTKFERAKLKAEIAMLRAGERFAGKHRYLIQAIRSSLMVKLELGCVIEEDEETDP